MASLAELNYDSTDVTSVNGDLLNEEIETAVGYKCLLTYSHTGGVLDALKVQHPSAGSWPAGDDTTIDGVVAAHNSSGTTDDQQLELDYDTKREGALSDHSGYFDDLIDQSSMTYTVFIAWARRLRDLLYNADNTLWTNPGIYGVGQAQTYFQDSYDLAVAAARDDAKAAGTWQAGWDAYYDNKKLRTFFEKYAQSLLELYALLVVLGDK